MDVSQDLKSGEHNGRDPLTYRQMLLSLEKIFTDNRNELQHVIHLASRIRAGIAKLDPFILESNRVVCGGCAHVCCINKHVYYNREDLIYLSALGLTPPHVVFGRNDTDPCQHLRADGCSLERWRRPSGCTWYFCDSLLDYIEHQSWYCDFDDTLRDVAELWLAMTDEFRRLIE